jgi:cytochrome P450
VINETLRIYPTVPVTTRTSPHTTTLMGTPIPSGTRLIFAPWSVNKDPSIWGENAAIFDPSRWIDPGTGKPNSSGGVGSNYGFLTFLHGPRSCIGQGFARAELRALVAAFVGRFEFGLAEPEREVVPAGIVTVKPKGGLKLRVRRVGEWW